MFALFFKSYISFEFKSYELFAIIFSNFELKPNLSQLKTDFLSFNQLFQ